MADQYQRVKELFLEACERPRAEWEHFVRTSAPDNATIQKEVLDLLAEHARATPLIPENPVPPLGAPLTGLSSILSRAQAELEGEGAGKISKSRGSRGRHREGHALSRDDALVPVGAEEPSSFFDDSTPSSNSGIVDAGRFMAGTIVAGRYRIIELLGRGGMGEVYRADDLTLNQSVALKFLPTLFGQDEKWLERFRNEVRLARQVTHPNVCRVFDIGEFQGEQFISMEYVDGENLGSLLRRIGRVPEDKAMQIARQLCAGLSAAHDRGVLHRDLKPANVMIDGRGAVRITDFGLAAPTDGVRQDRLRAGTPAYMSPEQLAGKTLTVRSDIYSLGLVLYEMMTGRRVYKADSLREYQKLHSSSNPTPPSDIVDDIDPITNRVILKCLEKDPRNRPGSAMAVSAALPGGNPLREILAAGETPSPAVVAAAGESHTGLSKRNALIYVLVGIAAMALAIFIAPRVVIVQKTVGELPPVVLSSKARDILSSLGFNKQPTDSANGYAVDAAYYEHLQEARHPGDHRHLLTRSRPGLIYFWYRESQSPLATLQPNTSVSENDPPTNQPGMVKISLDVEGRLIGLEANPSDPASSLGQTGVEVEGSSYTTTQPAGATSQSAMKTHWYDAMLAAAQVDDSHFRNVKVADTALPVYADQRAAWEGAFPDASDEQLHIEAAAFHGKPVFFSISGTWKDKKLSPDELAILSAGRVNIFVQIGVSMMLIIAGSVLAMRNYKAGRGDRQGALRLALASFALGLCVWVFRTHHVYSLLAEFKLFTQGLAMIMFTSVLAWIFYIALEPYVRRGYPEMIISWSRVLSGRWVDPLVGRDALIGAVAGTLSVLVTWGGDLFPMFLHQPIPTPPISYMVRMLGTLSHPFTILNSGIVALYAGLILLLYLVILRRTFKSRWLVAPVFILTIVGATGQWQSAQYANLVAQAIVGAVFLTLLVRQGLVALFTTMLVRTLLMDFPITYGQVWYAPTAWLAICLVLFVLIASTYAAVGGRSLIVFRPPQAT